jgi:uncharacterized cupredoxin-like copper-binding protein
MITSRLTRVALLGVALAGSGTPAAAQAPRIVAVTAHDFRFEAPTSVPAGTITFALTNAGKEVHHLWVVRLTGGKTPADFDAAMKAWGSALKMPKWAIDVGGPSNVGAGATASGTMTLEPGTYMLVCWVPSPDGMLHVMKGMVKPLTVTKSGATPAAEPAADLTMTLDDYSFAVTPPITAGRHTIRIVNRAAQSHEAVIVRLLPGKTMAQAVTWLNEGQVGPAPVQLLGGASGLAQGRQMFITADFPPGQYALLCYMPDAKDGKAHSVHGMLKEFTVSP